MDTINGHYKSLDGNKHAQIFVNELFFATAYPMEHKTSAGQVLKQFISDFGIPDKLVCDGTAEQVGKRTEFKSTVQKHAINLHVTDRLNDEAHIIIEGGKSQPYDWSDHPFDKDSDFVDEFHLVVSNDEI